MSGSSTLAQEWPARPQAGAWTTSRRIMVCATVLLLLELAGFVFFVAGTHGWITPLRRPVSTDFVSFYAAGRLADAGTPALVYDQGAHYAAEQAATEPGIAYNYFYYPPIFLLLCAVLARLPYLGAFVVFQVGTLVPSLLVVRRILHERGWAILVPLLAFPPVFFTLGTGQNAFLSATLFGAATLLVDRRPALAGVLFGALCYKPHFGLLVPVALLAAGRWRAFTAAGLTVAGLIGLSVQVLGLGTWRAFFAAAFGAHQVYETGVAHPAMASPFGVVLAFGGSPALAYAAQAVVTTIMAATVFWVWRRGLSLPVRAATLLTATLLAVPVALFYDLVLSGVALAWLVRCGQQHGLPAWLRTGVTALYIAALLTGNFGPGTHLVVTPLIALGAFVLAAAAAWQERGRAMSAQISPSPCGRGLGEGAAAPISRVEPSG
jgi:alpha-1,2-mannosyltransferase